MSEFLRRIGLLVRVRCPECDREFDLADEDDADEWANGHDCPPEEE